MAEDNNSNYAGNLARAVGQGITFGFGDELEARFRALTGDRSYDEEVADIRESIEQFRETNPVAAYGSEIVGSIPTGLGLAGLALRGGLKGAAKIGALEGSIYGVGEGEGVEGTATSAAIGAGLGGALGKAGEKAFEGIAPLVGKFMKRTRGSGIEAKGSGNIEMDSSPSNLGPMVRDLEAGSDEFVPLEKTVGEPGTPGEVKPVLNPAVKRGASIYGDSDNDYFFVQDYSPLESVLANSKQVLGEGKKGFTGEQLIPRLKKAGVTDAEIEVSGIDAFAASNRTVKRPASDYLTYVKENAPDVDYTVKYKSRGQAEDFEDMDPNYGAFLHEDTQRLIKPNVASEVDYGELVVYNRKAPEASTKELTHHPDVRGSFAHVRFSDHNDASGGVSRFVEENQFDVVQQQYGKEPISDKVKKNFIDLTPAKIDEIEGKISQLQDSPDYKAFQGFRQEQLDLDAKVASIKQKERAFDSEKYDRKNGFNRTVTEGAESFLSIGKSMRQPGASRAMIDAEFSVAAPGFLKGVLQGVLNENSTKELMLNADQLKEALRKGIDFPSDSRAFGSPHRIARPELQDSDRIKNKIDSAALKISREIEQFAIESINRGRNFDGSIGARPIRLSDVLQTSEDSTMFVRNLLSEIPDSRQIDFKSIVKEQEAFNVKKREAVQNRRDATDLQIQRDNLTSRVNEKRDKIFNSQSDELVEYMYKNQYVGAPIRETDVEFVTNQPFRNQKQAARHNIAMVIKDARASGIDRIYFPDYRDVAELRGVDAKAFKITYEDAPKKYIEELKKEFPDLRTGKLTPDEFVEDHMDANVDHPVTYLDLNFSKSDESIAGRDNLLPRRYKRGGPVDMRSGIGDLFRIYS